MLPNKSEMRILLGIYTNKKKIVTNNHDYMILGNLIEKDLIELNGCVKNDKRKLKYILTEKGFIFTAILYDLETGIIHERPIIKSEDYELYYFKQTSKQLKRILEKQLVRQ